MESSGKRERDALSISSSTVAAVVPMRREAPPLPQEHEQPSAPAAAPRGWAVAVGASKGGLTKSGCPESEPRSVGAAAPAGGTRLRTTCVSVAVTKARPALTRSARERLSGVRGLRGAAGAGGARHSLPPVRGLSPRRARGPRGTSVLRAWPREQVFRTSHLPALHSHFLSLHR